MRLAIFTLTKNDPWLPLWANNARTQGFSDEDIYILNHQSNGTFGDKLLPQLARRHPVIQVRHPQSYDYSWMTETISNFQRFLIGHYDMVVFTAADELMYPTRAARVVDALREDSSRFVGEYVTGWEVVQQPHEVAIDLDRPWDIQRSTGFESDYYRRIRVTRGPLLWAPPLVGQRVPFGSALNVSQHQTAMTSVVVAHMHRADTWMMVARHREISLNRELKNYPPDQAPYQHNITRSMESLLNWLPVDLAKPGKTPELKPLPMIAKESVDGRGISVGEAGQSSVSIADSAGGT